MQSRMPFPLLSSFVLVTSFLMVTSSPCSHEGATEDLRSVVKGRCVDFKRLNPSAVCNQTYELNCTQAVELFVEAFVGQPICNVTIQRFDVFLDFTRHPIPADKSTFWHETYGFVHRYSERGQRKVTLEDTLTGYLVDGLRFCPAPGEEEGGIGSEGTGVCPGFSQTQDCPWSAMAAFWTAASQNFATKARGVITVMLNGSAEEAFSESSYLGRWEIPNLKADEVTRADIWLVHTPGDKIRETCDSASIKQLEQMLSTRNIPSTCTANPEDALWLLCWDRRDHPECNALQTSGTTSTSAVGRTLGLIVFSVLFFCFIK